MISQLKKLNALLVVICFFMITFALKAAPVQDMPVTLTQPDGTVIKCYASGDEFINCFHDKDGHVIVQDQNTGYYVYAVYKNGFIEPSDVSASEPGKKTKYQYSLVDKEMSQLKYRSVTTFGSYSSGQDHKQKMPTKGTVNNIVIFIKFKGEPEFLKPGNQYEKYFNSTNAGDNSLYNYYKEASYGKLNIVSHSYPKNGQVVFSYTAPEERGYYRPYSPTNPIGYTSKWEGPKRLHALLTSAVNYIDSQKQVPQSLNIDANGDGEIDLLTFVLSGNLTTDKTGMLWPHKWELEYTYSQEKASINGKKAVTYNLHFSEVLDEKNGGVGILAHEIFHFMGAPELYRVHNWSSMIPVGPWDLMAKTMNIPQHMMAYMKYEYGQWIDSIPEIKTSGTYTLNPLTSNTNNVYKIKTSIPHQYYVLEYRQRQGIYERNLPAEGLLVYRVDTSVMFGNEFGHGLFPSKDDAIYVFRPINFTEHLNKAALGLDSGVTSLNTSKDYGEIFADDGRAKFNITNVSIQNGKLIFDVNFDDTGSAPEFSIPDNAKFYGEVGVTISHPNPNAQIYYTTDGTTPTNQSILYKSGEKIYLSQTTQLKAVAYINGVASAIKSTTYEKVSTVETEHPYKRGQTDQWWVIGFKGANRIQLSFDERSKFAVVYPNDYDKLYILNEEGSIIEDGLFTEKSLSGKTIEVDGSQVLLHFQSIKYTGSDHWGFKVTSIIPQYPSQYQGAMWGPGNGETISGVKQVSGWCISDKGINKMELLIDGSVCAPAVRFEVPALKDIFPGYNTSQAGFVYYLDTNYLTNGYHQIAIKATGTDGTSYVVGPVTINVNNIPQYQASMWRPDNGETVSGVKQVSGWCINKKGISKMELLIDGAVCAPAIRFEVPTLKDMFPDYNTTQAGFVYYLDTTYLSNGYHQIAIRATGTNGTSHVVGPVTINVNNTSKYQASIWSPGRGEAVSGIKQITGWCINERGIKEIELFVDGKAFGSATRFEVPALKEMFPGYNTSQAGFVYNLDTRYLTNGTHEIMLKATGTDGTNYVIGSVPITVFNSSKYAGDLWVPNTGKILTGVSQISGWCINTKGISKVEILIDGMVYAPASRFEIYSLQYDFPGYNTNQGGFVYYLDTKNLTNGTHQIAIKATGTDGTSYVLGPVTVNVNNPSKASDITSEAEAKSEPASEKDSEEESRLQPERKSQVESEVKTVEEPETIPDAELKTESEIESDSGSETEPKLMISEERMITGTVDGLSSDPISGVHTIQGTIAYADQQIKLELLVDGKVFDNIDFELDEDLIIFEYDFDTMRFEDGKYTVTLQVVTSSGQIYVIKDVQIMIMNTDEESI